MIFAPLPHHDSRCMRRPDGCTTDGNSNSCATAPMVSLPVRLPKGERVPWPRAHLTRALRAVVMLKAIQTPVAPPSGPSRRASAAASGTRTVLNTNPDTKTRLGESSSARRVRREVRAFVSDRDV